jgi:predicted RNA-binding Zn-ribbon protein involved in translation (DUF1610 family)
MELGLDNMNCPLCSANARQIGITNDIASINCTVCGEYLIARSVLAKEQLQTLDQERRGGLAMAKRSAQPVARLMVTICSLVSAAL